MITRCFTARIAAALLIPLLISCQSAPTRLFTVEPIAPTSRLDSYRGPAIRVQAVHIPPGLDRTEIVSGVGLGELKVNDLDHWIAPLGELSRQALTIDLLTRLPQGRILFQDVGKPAGAISISVNLLAFNVDREGAKLQVSWMGTSDGLQPHTCGGTMVLQTGPPGVGSAAMAKAFSTLLAKLADGIVVALSLLPPAGASIS